MSILPTEAIVRIRLEALIKHDDDIKLHERMSSRMVQCAAVLPQDEFLGWQIYVPDEGMSVMTLFGSKGIDKRDLEWVAEHTAIVADEEAEISIQKNLTELYEIALPLKNNIYSRAIGFGGSSVDKDNVSSNGLIRWPKRYASQFAEIIRAFQISGAVFMAVLGKADEKEQERCRKSLLDSWNVGEISPVD